MTRGEMESSVIADLEEMLPGSYLQNSPRSVREAVEWAVDQVAERTQCLHTARTMDVVAKDVHYAPSGLIRHTSVLMMAQDGNYYPISTKTPWEYDGQSTYWRSDLQSVESFHAVVVPDGRIQLSPVPSRAIPAGLRVEGFYKPGKAWLFDAVNPVDPDELDPCPLPDWSIDAAKALATHRFAERLIVRYPAVKQLLPMLDAHATELLGQAHATSTQIFATSR